MRFEPSLKKEQPDSVGNRIFAILFIAALCPVLLGGAFALRDVISPRRSIHRHQPGESEERYCISHSALFSFAENVFF